MKKKSKRKNDIRTSLLLLLLLLLLLISATYAWFTANQTVTISTLDVNIEAKNGLQISTDAVTWKSIISKEDITTNAYSGHANQVPTSLEPVSTVGEIDSSTGYMKMYYGSVTADETDGLDKLSATLETSEVAGSSGKYIAFDVFLKVDTDTDIQLTSSSGVSAKGTDKGIKQASRVAFCVQGTKPAGTKATDITSLKDATSFLSGEGKSVYIWEPNANLHEAAAVSHAKSNYNIDITTTGTDTAVKYYGIKSPISADSPIALANTYTASDYFAKVSPDYVTNGEMVDTDVFTLSAGITKVRIYMWIEGQDVDCENTASGTDISFDIQFQVKS